MYSRVKELDLVLQVMVRVQNACPLVKGSREVLLNQLSVDGFVLQPLISRSTVSGGPWQHRHARGGLHTHSSESSSSSGVLTWAPHMLFMSLDPPPVARS